MKKTIMILLMAIIVMACKKKTTEPTPIPVVTPTPESTYKVRVVCGYRIKQYTSANCVFNLADSISTLHSQFLLNYTSMNALRIKDTTFNVVDSKIHWKASWSVKFVNVPFTGILNDSSFMRIYINDTLKSSQISIMPTSNDTNGFNNLYYFK